MTRRRLWILAASVAVVLGGWTFYLEPRSLELTSHELVVPGWPAELDGLEVALLSDLHVGSPYYGLDKFAEVVRRVNAAEPDLILLAGDFVIHGVRGGQFVTPESMAPVLGGLRAPMGVFAVLGNHDHWLDGARVRRSFENAGIRFLEDEAAELDGFWLVGLKDFWAGDPDVDRALERVPDGEPILAFTHNPDLFPEIPARVSLTLAGHTHGGQVRIPLIGTPIVPSAHGERFAYGHIVEEGRHLFVTGGLGTSIIPARFRVPPEIVHLTLGAAAVSER